MAPKHSRAKHFSVNEKLLLINKNNFEDVQSCFCLLDFTLIHMEMHV